MAAGLREKKKLQVRQALAQAAFRLFAERGFANVTVAEVAALAGTSVQTVFNYFEVKEDLVLDGLRLHDEALVEAIVERPKGMSALEAVRSRTLAAAEDFFQLDPELNAQFRKIVTSTPSIMARMRERSLDIEARIASQLASETGAGPADPQPRIAATLLINLSHLAYMPSEQGPAGTRLLIEQGFALISEGLAGYAVRD